MKIMSMLIICLFAALPPSDVPTIASLRKLYDQAAENSSAAATLAKSLKAINEHSAPLLLCYKGAAFMMEAKYAFNPVTKFSRFNKGKMAIEQAIKKDPEQLEMRFIRFSIQTNLPAFLGYDNEIQADKLKLLAAVALMDDKVLKQNVTRYLITSKQCTKEELKKLQH